MLHIGIYWAKFLCKVMRSHEPLNNYYRKGGVKIGNNCLICSNLLTREAFLISIGNNTTVSTEVTFVTHDNCAKLLVSNVSDVFGAITIGDNCFIGQNATIMYGVSLADNIIVAAGSVVTKSFYKNNIIIGGNPAREIGTWESLKKKIEGKAILRKDLKEMFETDTEFLIKR